jgi:hypothetical protein
VNTVADQTPEQGRLLGVALLGLVLALFVASLTDLEPGPLKPGLGATCLGLYMMLLGAMALAAYYYPHKTFLFRWIIWCARRHKNDDYGFGKALFIFVLAFGGGFGAFLKGLGLV